jgi:hypothetical protein
MTTKTEWNVEGNGRRFVVYREEDGLRKWTIAEWLDSGPRQQTLTPIGMGYHSRQEALDRAKEMTMEDKS